MAGWKANLYGGIILPSVKYDVTGSDSTQLHICCRRIQASVPAQQWLFQQIILLSIARKSNLPVGHEEGDPTQRHFLISPHGNRDNGMANQFPMQIIKILFKAEELHEKETIYRNTNDY